MAHVTVAILKGMEHVRLDLVRLVFMVTTVTNMMSHVLGQWVVVVMRMPLADDKEIWTGEKKTELYLPSL